MSQPGATQAPAERPVLRIPARAELLPRLRQGGIILPFLVLFIVLSVASGPFFTKVNLLDILDQQASTLIIAAAGTLVLVAGGIDLSVGAIYELLTSLAAEGMGVLLISSDVEEILGLAHRVLVMRSGRIAAELGTGEITEEAVLGAAFGAAGGGTA